MHALVMNTRLMRIAQRIAHGVSVLCVSATANLRATCVRANGSLCVLLLLLTCVLFCEFDPPAPSDGDVYSTPVDINHVKAKLTHPILVGRAHAHAFGNRAFTHNFHDKRARGTHAQRTYVTTLWCQQITNPIFLSLAAHRNALLAQYINAATAKAFACIVRACISLAAAPRTVYRLLLYAKKKLRAAPAPAAHMLLLWVRAHCTYT